MVNNHQETGVKYDYLYYQYPVICLGAIAGTYKSKFFT